MDIFFRTLEQMVTIFLLIGIGFFLRKLKILPENADKVMAKMETFIFCPALALYTQMTKCTVETFSADAPLILYGAALVFGAILLSYPLSAMFVRDHKLSPQKAYQRDIYKYALTYGNYGFLGNFLALSVWGQDFFYQYSLYTLFLSILGYAWGMYVLIPKDYGASIWVNLKKGLTTPAILAMAVGILLGLTNTSQYVPGFVASALENAGNCMGPVAMILAGVVIGGYDFKELLKNKKVYIATALRLFIIPAAMLLLLHGIGVDKTVKTVTLIAFAAPLGMNTVVFPAAYDGDTKTGASMVMISHVLSVATIPLMYYLFIVLL